ncbi:hypothetical protein ACIB24_10585 [Spongisporangium articulatum]|uniref:Uncharacterized protein n=1 Tax=Spongisporangium articulatum TaxID=3362603 RepID=A0ABW8APF7_9ACTN
MAVLEFPHALPSTAAEVREFTDWLVGAELPADDAGRLELIETLEVLKAAAAAVQAETTVVYAVGKESRRVVADVAAARHESPQKTRTAGRGREGVGRGDALHPGGVAGG